MSAESQRATDYNGGRTFQESDWIRVPTVVNSNGDKVVILYDDRGQPQTRMVAELILETFVGPQPHGSLLRFKDGNRLNCEVTNLEWVAAQEARTDAERARAVATPERADAMRRSLEGRAHSDSACLLAEDRLR